MPENTSHSCGHACVFGPPRGVGTNGPCRCFEGVGREQRQNVQRAVFSLRGKLAEADKQRLRLAEVLGLEATATDDEIYAITAELSEESGKKALGTLINKMVEVHAKRDGPK